jgi:hypothetical protein
MTLYNPAENNLASRLDDEREIGLAVVTTRGGILRVMLTVDGKLESFRMARHVAASLVAEIANVLAKSA